jgi:hypothetical protein
VDDAGTGQTAVLLLNRSLTDNMELSITLRGLGLGCQLAQAEQLQSAGLNAAHTVDVPGRAAPSRFLAHPWMLVTAPVVITRPDQPLERLDDPNRHTRVQAFDWRASGFPDFGTPVADGPYQL